MIKYDLAILDGHKAVFKTEIRTGPRFEVYWFTMYQSHWVKMGCPTELLITVEGIAAP